MELLDETGEVFNVGKSRTPLTLIVVWANWCSRCMRELGTVGDLPASLGDGNLDVVLVSHPDDWLLNQKVVAERRLRVRCARPSEANNPAELRRAFVSADGVFYVPHSILFSRERQAVVWDHIGAVDYASQAAMSPVRKWLPT